MRYKLLIRISLSLLRARFRQTLVAAIGVTFGITMFISLLSFMGGLNQLLDSLVLNRTPHIRLYNELLPSAHQPIDRTPAFRSAHNFVPSVKPHVQRQDIYNSQAILQVLKNDPEVMGVAPKMTAAIFYKSGGINFNGVINGIDVIAESKLFTFEDYVTEGRAIDLKNTPNSIILGVGAAHKMLAKIGETIQVTTSDGTNFPLKVVGMFQSGLDEIDKVQSYTSLATAQKLLGKPNTYISDIQVKLYDINLAPAKAISYAKRFGTQATDIQTANAQFETGSSIRTLISYAVGVTLLIVAGFGIYNILNMMIYEKMDSIAILKATGFSGGDVQIIFILIAQSIGIFGGALGLLLGFLFSLVIDQIPFVTPSLPTVSTYPVDYNPKFYLIGASFSLFTTYLAGYFPSRKASKIDPVIIIRGK